MSTLKSVNWALAWRRSIWTIVWAAMMALLVVMCIDLAANQPVIFGIVMLAAFVGSIGLAYTRVSWQNGARATAVAALVVSVLAIATHAFMEASYWSSVIEQINQEVTAERAVSDARAAVAAKRKERYVSSSNGRSAGQIEAELKASETNLLFSRSASCTDATAKESRDFCQGYFLLKAKHAAAIEAGQLEGVIWSAGTTVETTTKRNLASIAVMASSIFGGQPEQYTALIVITLVLFTQALLAFALVIGWAPEKAKEAAGAAFQRPLSLAGSFADPAYSAVPVAPRAPLKALEKISGAKVGNPLENPVSSPEVFGDASKNPVAEQIANSANCPPDPTGPGTPAPMPEAPKIEEVAEEDPKIVRPDQWKPENATGYHGNLDWKLKTKAEKRAERKKHKQLNKLHKPHGAVQQWVREWNVRKDPDGAAKTFQEVFDAYKAWCGDDLVEKRNNTLGRQIRQVLELPGSREEGQRTGKSSKYQITWDEPIVAQARRKVA